MIVIKIRVGKDKWAIIDPDNYDFLSQWTWSLSNGYATRRLKRVYEKGKSPRQRDQKMHRLVMGEPIGFQIDHINGDKLDNRRKNLRLCTPHQNRCNKPFRKDNTSGYKGITRRRGKWMAQIASNKKHYNLGVFQSKIEAAKAYDHAARKLHGEFAWTNFPME